MKKRKMREYKEETGNRRSREYLYWRQGVLISGGFTCDLCGKFDGTGKSFDCHHLESYTKNEEEQYNIDNAVILCRHEHKLFHKQYGYTGFSKEDYEQFKFKHKGTV